VSLIIGKFEPSDPETYPIAGLETFLIIYAHPPPIDRLHLRGNKFGNFIIRNSSITVMLKHRRRMRTKQ
jgi:hypothetical protein